MGCAHSANEALCTSFAGFAYSAQVFGFRIWPLPALFDIARLAPVSTTVGWGIGTTALAVSRPLLVDPVGVTPFDPRPDGQRQEVIPVDRQQSVRIARQVAVTLVDSLLAHEAQRGVAVEAGREPSDRLVALRVSDDGQVRGHDPHARHKDALGQPVEAEAGFIDAEAEQRAAHVFGRAACLAVPDDALPVPSIVDRQRGFAVVVAWAGAVGLVALTARRYEGGDMLVGADFWQRAEMAQRFVASGHPGNASMARKAAAWRYVKMTTPLAIGEKAGPARFLAVGGRSRRIPTGVVRGLAGVGPAVADLCDVLAGKAGCPVDCRGAKLAPLRLGKCLAIGEGAADLAKQLCSGAVIGDPSLSDLFQSLIRFHVTSLPQVCERTKCARLDANFVLSYCSRMDTATKPLSLYDAMTVTVPEGSIGTLRVERFTVEPDSFENFRLAMRGGRQTRPGTYTALRDGGCLWMSDTDAEKRDHMAALHAIRSWEAKRVLINGLGLGMVLAAALTFDHVEHVDVVEIDERVIELVGPHYAGPRVTIHHADAYEQVKQWPAGTRWDVAWHDIWPHLCTDNLPEMARLHRSYGRRVDWQGSWGKALREQHRATSKRSRRGW